MYRGLYVKYPFFFSDFNKSWILDRFKKIEVLNFMKIRPVGAELFHADIQTDMKKVKVAFRNFMNSSINPYHANVENRVSSQ